ncbi:MAG: cobalamin-dependent protein [Halanaerobium sp.]|nr:cobalamin-dependent protein [Halanaerobium sp.]
MKKAVLLAPLDPVHDIGLKMINRALLERGHQTILLPPDIRGEEIINRALQEDVDIILVSRTVGYGVAELLGSLIDLTDAAGLREFTKIAIGGMAIKPELAAELGFDAGFGPGTTVEEAVAFVEGREYLPGRERPAKHKPDLTAGYDYHYFNPEIARLLEEIASRAINLYSGFTSPAIERALLREELFTREKEGANSEEIASIQAEYARLCSPAVAEYYRQRILPAYLRRLGQDELAGLAGFIANSDQGFSPPDLKRNESQPVIFVQYGTGCPLMDIAHIKAVEAWGADGVVHFDPSWGARVEGILQGPLTHQENGSVITSANLELIKNALLPSTLWQVRAHRGLNTPETVLLAGEAGAELTKVNIAYGSLAGGTDPERLTVDAIAALQYAARYGLPFDIPTNEELAGVPAYKAFAGMLITAQIGLMIGARPVLQPLFCYSPEVMLGGQMEDNYLDFNYAKVRVLRGIISAPIWPGAPIGFLTHTEERVQSAVTTGLHAGLAAAIGVDAISIASSDEAYSGGPITIAARIDTLQAVKENYRFLGQASYQPTPKAKEYEEVLLAGIYQVLREVAARGDLVRALYEGLLGTEEDGAYPGRNGKNTVNKYMQIR